MKLTTAQTFEGISRYIENNDASNAWSPVEIDWGFYVLGAQVRNSATGILNGTTRFLFRFKDGSELLFENGVYRALD